ncbi:unnamed protein product [Blepharisma stoltei]|uniref:UBC core domain-containing protein n=1 Tax=Blepharisma stoltei TaxID=1481888 RepID=A0AAU9K090_9CILI|nr:unnamed protein product [Blepharisma stoltei]
MSRQCLSRLHKEYEMIMKDPIPNAIACPDPQNWLHWHFVVFGLDKPYTNGVYHCELRFPIDYPMAPPSIIMHTPSGRFDPGQRICTSMSDYHPESWSPIWSVSTIIMGFISFMQSEENAAGTVSASNIEKQRLALLSKDFNMKCPKFMELFEPFFAQIMPKETVVKPPAVKEKSGSNWFFLGMLLMIIVGYYSYS